MLRSHRVSAWSMGSTRRRYLGAVRRYCVSVVVWALSLALPAAVAFQMGTGRDVSPVSLDGNADVDVKSAIQRSVGYLVQACSPRGRFAYLVDIKDGSVSRSYNIVRHAGAIYSLAMYNRFHPDARVVDTMARAAAFMRTVYMSREPRSNELVVWSKAVGFTAKAELGGSGLGLVALTEVARARPGSISVGDLQSLGRSVLSMQRPDGSFFSRYVAGVGPVGEGESLYYPGEAALGLIDFYEVDHSRQWLDAAAKGLSYLAKSRHGLQEIPDDHWALIATAKLLTHYDRAASPASREELIQHVRVTCEAMLSEQVTTSDEPMLIGGFTLDGRTTPTATRLEGLMAAWEFLPRGEAALRARIESSAKLGVAFLLRAEIVSGPFAGGMPAVIPRGTSVVMRDVERESEVRIDYVQHALCAWLWVATQCGSIRT
jgi:hypothetical protein